MPEDNVTPGSTDLAADDWAAAIAEQNTISTDRGNADAVTDADAEQPHVFQPITKSASSNNAGTGGDIDLILDIPVTLTVELGRTRIPIKHILQLAQGSVIELDAMAGEPMDVLVNGCLIAQGEVVVVNEKFGIRLTDIVTPSERIRRLNR